MNKLTAEKCREQFEAWWEENQHNGNPPRFGWDHYRDGETYSDDEFQTLWEVWKGSRQALEIALPILEQQEQGDEGWIEWRGGECPAFDYAVVAVRFRNYSEAEEYAGGLWWGRYPSRETDADIIAYRIIPERANKATLTDEKREWLIDECKADMQLYTSNSPRYLVAQIALASLEACCIIPQQPTNQNGEQ